MHLDPQAEATPRSRMRTMVLAVISLAAVAITAFSGVAQAAPKQPATPTYDASWNASSLTLALHNAKASTDNGTLTIRDFSGKELFRMPLAYRLEDRQFPIDARQAGNKVTLIPSRDAARSVKVDAAEVEQLRGIARHRVAAPETRQERDDQALARFQQQLQTGMTVSSLVGMILGGIVGGIIGGMVTLAATPLVSVLVGIPIGASAGAIVGLALGGGGTLIGAAIHYFQTINSPFVPPKK